MTKISSNRREAIGALDTVSESFSYLSSTNNALNVNLSEEGLVPGSFDYIAATYPDSVTEIYTYRDGGAGGTIVGVVTVVYTDTTKADLDTVTRT